MKSEILQGYRTRKELAEQLGVSWQTLLRWEESGKGPPVTRFGSRVLYSKAGTERWRLALESAETAAA